LAFEGGLTTEGTRLERQQLLGMGVRRRMLLKELSRGWLKQGCLSCL
jgi:hypothetical protein